jgi:hypothetical protein
MRYVTIPKDALIETAALDGTREPMAFTFLLMKLWTLDPSFSERGVEGLEQALKIRSAFRDKKPGDTVALEDSDWSALAGVIQRPSPKATPLPRLIDAIELFRAVIDAPSTAPGAEPIRARRTG